MPRKPVSQAEKNAPARAFALPEQAAAPSRSDRTADPARSDRKRDDKEMKPAKDERPQPGQGAEHRSDRANEVARGAGLGRPKSAEAKAEDAVADVAEAGETAGASPATATADASKSEGTPDAKEILAKATDAGNGAPTAQAETGAAAPADPQQTPPVPAVDPAIALQIALETPALQAELTANSEVEGQEASGDEAEEAATGTDATGEPTPAPVPFVALTASATGTTPTAGGSGAPGVQAVGQPATQAGAAGIEAAQAAIAAANVATETTAGTDTAAGQDKSADAPQGLALGQSPEGAPRAQEAQPAVKTDGAPAQPAVPAIPGQPMARGGEHHHRAEQGQAAQLPTPPESRPTPIQGVPMEVGFRSLEGHKRFDIRLDPGDLGRVEVRLELGDEGSVKATLTVERPETLHMMQRETRALERALEQAGFRPSDGSIDLRLSDRAPDRQQGGEQEQGRHQPSKPDAAVDGETVRLLHPAQLSRQVAAAMGGVDLVI